MDTIKLHGGLGNQLFQYGFGQGLRKANGASVNFEVSFFENPPRGATVRNLDILELNLIVPIANQRFLFDFLGSKFARGLNIHAPRWRRVMEYDTGGASVLPDVNKYWYGYWQNIDSAREITEIHRSSSIFPKVASESLTYLSQIENVNSVFVHIRRGDLAASTKIQRIHGICDLNYYMRAMEYIVNRQRDVIFFVFSDDLAWCKANFSSFSNVVFVPSDAKTPAWRDLALMSRCKHSITANSTYSWWGAWLNDNETKVVVVPDFWMKANAKRNLIPTQWVAL